MKNKVNKVKKLKNKDEDQITNDVSTISIPKYKSFVKVMGKTYEATGETISEAISKLNIKNCKGKAIIGIKVGELTKERILMPDIIFRLFNNVGLTREIALKQISSLFKGL